jgi:hypothetical protein
MTKTIALLSLLAFAAPIAASAQAPAPQPSAHAQLVQVIEQTYHTNFANTGK